jgi:hypothetical protein
MLLGAAGAAIPIAIHLIGRRRAKLVRFAAMDFLLGSNKRVARRLQLRELLLLAARVLVCIAIPLALAKPFTACAAAGPQVERGPQAAVFVIDNSLASSYQLDGETLIARARTQARKLLDDMGPEADVAIVLAAEGSTAPDEFSRDHLELRDAIAAIDTVPRPADITMALSRAQQLLDSSRQARKNIFLLSPMAAAGFHADGPVPADMPALTIIDPAGGRHLQNAAVVDIGVSPDPNAGSRGVQVITEIANFGTEAIDEREVRLLVEGRVLATSAVSLRPGERVKKRFAAPLPEGKRITDVVVELAEDALPADDRRYVRAELRDQVRALLVDGDPRTVRHDDELFYLETALRPGDRGDSGVAVTTTTVDALAELSLDDYDVLVLANVRALPADRVLRIARWMHGGGGVFVTVGSRVNADAYNATMSPLLPQQLRDPIDTAYGAQGAEREGRALRLAKLEREHPIFSVFTEEAAGLREARFHKVMLLGPTTRVEDRKVLARFSNGATALIEARSGDGRLLLFTATIDRDWTDLPIHSGYLPLVQRAVRYLAHKPDDTSRASVLVGRRHTIPIPAETTRVEIVGPSGRRTVMEGERVADRNRIAFAETGAPGFYRVAIAGADGDSAARDVDDFAVNVDARASNVARVDPSNAPPREPGAVTDGTAAAQHKRRVELWHAIAIGLLALLVLESVIVLR